MIDWRGYTRSCIETSLKRELSLRFLTLQLQNYFLSLVHLQPNSAVSTRDICWIIGPIYSLVQDKTKFPDSFVPVSCELLFFLIAIIFGNFRQE